MIQIQSDKKIKYRLAKFQSSLQDLLVHQDTQLLRQFDIPRVMIRGEELSTFSWESWSSIQKAFERLGYLPLQQWWQEAEDTYFQSGLLQIGWKGNKIYLLVTMEDKNIVTSAQKNGERLWELGDVVEIFIKSPQELEYYELQVAPNGCVLQLKYPHFQAIENLRRAGMVGLEDFVITEPLFTLQSQTEDSKWNVLVEIPGEILFFKKAASLLECSCQISVSRYDYWADARPPSLSSISPHRKLDFHQQKDWGLVKFVKAAAAPNSMN